MSSLLKLLMTGSQLEIKNYFKTIVRGEIMELLDKENIQLSSQKNELGRGNKINGSTFTNKRKN